MTSKSLSSREGERSGMTWSDTDDDEEESPAKRVKLTSDVGEPTACQNYLHESVHLQCRTIDSLCFSGSSSSEHHDHYSLVSQRIMVYMHPLILYACMPFILYFVS